MLSKDKRDMLDGVEGIIFDLDGTLIDSMWIWPSIDDEYLEKYQLEKPDFFHEDMEGMSYTEVAGFFLKVFPDLDRTLEEVMEEWMEMAWDKYIHQVSLKEGAYAFVTEMKKRGIKLGIATSNARELVDATLEALEIEDVFDVVRSACEVAAGKPSPDVYLLVAEELGIDPAHCLVFEDVPMGILAGKNAGMKVCAVEDDFSKPQEEKKRMLADYYIQDFFDIQKKTYEVL